MSGPVDTWMPMFIGDYLADTSHLTTEQHGAYLLLLFAAWKKECKLRCDDCQLAAICKLPPEKWAKHKAVLQEFFEVQDGYWIQKRQAEEHRKALRIQANRSQAGTTAVKARWKQEKEKPVDPNNPWSLGKMMLKQQGMKDDQTGRFIGKLIKDHGETPVLEALKAAQQKPPADLKGYLLGILGNKSKAKGFTDGLKRLAQQAAATGGESVPGTADDIREQDAKAVGER